MHTLWKGAISFGLVNVPVKMFAATEDKDISMKMLHSDCGGPISYVRRCNACERDVEWAEIVKGYEYEPGRYVLFNKDELDQLAPDSSREIRILDFVDLEEIDPIYFQKTYYLGPGDTGVNAYSLLMESLKQTNKIGIAAVTIRNKSSLAALRVVGRCLAMETIFYPDEIRPVAQVPNLPEAVQVSDKELTMAKMLIEQLSTPFEPEKYQDEYRHTLMDAIQAKVAGEEIQVAPEQKRTNVIDLMSALQASLEAVQSDKPAQGGAGRATAGARSAVGGASEDDGASAKRGRGGRAAAAVGAGAGPGVGAAGDTLAAAAGDGQPAKKTRSRAKPKEGAQ